MRVSVETNTKALAALSLGLSTVASGDTARKIAQDTAAALQARVDRQFETGRDAYGSAWDPPKDGGKPGNRSGNLKRKVKVRAHGARIFLSADGVKYAGFFTRGTSRMTARGIFPDTNRLPAAWKADIEAIVRKHVRRTVRGR